MCITKYLGRFGSGARVRRKQRVSHTSTIDNAIIYVLVFTDVKNKQILKVENKKIV